MREASGDRVHNFSYTYTSAKLNAPYMFLRISDDILIERVTVVPIVCMQDVSDKKVCTL